MECNSDWILLFQRLSEAIDLIPAFVGIHNSGSTSRYFALLRECTVLEILPRPLTNRSRPLFFTVHDGQLCLGGDIDAKRSRQIGGVRMRGVSRIPPGHRAAPEFILTNAVRSSTGKLRSSECHFTNLQKR
jgi:hypothetical protein